MALERDPYARLRALAEGRDPNAPVDPAISTNPEQLERARQQAVYDTSSESGRAIRQGTEGIRATGYAARGLARVLAGDDAGVEDLRESQRVQQAADEFGPRVQNLDDIQGVGDAAEYARNVTLGQLPNIAVAAASGGTGAVGRAGLGALARNTAARAAGEVAERAVGRTLAREVGESVLSRELRQGTALGGAAGGTFLQTSSAPDAVLDPEGSGSLQERAGKAAIGAVATGAIEALPVMSLFRKYGLGAAEDAVTGSVLKRAGRAALSQGASEAATEVTQTAGERLAHKWINDNVQVIGPDAYGDYLNAAAGGFLGGAVFGAPSGLRGSSREGTGFAPFRARIDALGEKLRAAPQPVGETDLGGGDTVNSVFDTADAMVKETGIKAKKGVDTALNAAREQYDRIMKSFGENSVIDQSLDDVFAPETGGTIDDVLNAEPFDYTTESGTTVIGAQNQNPFFRFVDTARARTLAQQGVRADLATLAATLPEDRATELMRNGSIAEAAKLMRGDRLDTVNDGKLRNYFDALTPDGQKNFLRAAATMQELAASDQIQRNPKGKAVAAQIATPPAAVDVDTAREATSDFDTAQSTTEFTPLRDPQEAAKIFKRSAVIPGNAVPKDSFVVRDPKNRRRSFSGAQIGAAISQVRASQDFQDSTRTMNPTDRNAAAIATVLGDLQQAGYKVEPESIRAGMKLGKDWVLTEATAARVRNGMQPARRGKAQPTDRPRRPGSSAEDLNREYGRDQPVEETRNEVEQQLDESRVLAPRTGRPAELRVSKEGRVSEAEASDTGTIDRAAQRAEREQYEPDAFNALDRKLREYTGQDVAGDFDRRRDLFNEVRSEGRVVQRGDKQVRERLTPVQRAELRLLAQEFGEAMTQSALNKVNTAQRKWQSARRRAAAQPTEANQNAVKAARKALDKARDNYENAAERASRDAVQRPKGVPKSQRRKPIVERDAFEASKFAPDKLREGIKSENSRRGLYAQAQNILAADISEAERLAMLDEVDTKLADLRSRITTAAKFDVSNRDLLHSKEHYDAVRKALTTVTRLDKALLAVQPLANDKQKRLIQTLLKMASVRGVEFSINSRDNIPAGVVGGQHASDPKAPLKSKVALNFSSKDVPAQTFDPVYVLLHEAMHAATSYAEQTDTEARDAISQMLDHAREQAKLLGVNPDRMYGLSETQEFIAEAFSNPDLQELLRLMPAADTKRFQNLWEQFKDFVARLLGLSSKDATLLDEVFTVGLDMARVTADARNAALYRIFGLDAHIDDDPYMAASSGSQPTDWMQRLSPESRMQLMSAFNRNAVRKQIEESLSDDAHARLSSADEGPTVLVNAGIALAMQKRLNLGAGQTAVGQLFDTIRNVLQVPSQQAYARQVLLAINQGTPQQNYSAKAAVLAPRALAVHNFVQKNVSPAVQSFTRDIDQRMRRSGVPALSEMATLFSQRTGEYRADGAASYTRRVLDERQKRLNQFFELIKDMSDKEKLSLTRELQKGQKLTDPKGAAVQKFFKDFEKYMSDAGLDFGKIENYFPVSMDSDKVAAKKDEFIALMNEPEFAKAVAKGGGAEALWRVATQWNQQNQLGRVTFADGDHDPNFRALNLRVSAFIYKLGTPEQIARFAEFQDNRIERIAAGYISRGVRRAEWARADLGPRIKLLMTKAQSQGATPAQLDMAKDYVDQIMGSYGQDWNPFVKRMFEQADKVFGSNLANTDFKKFQRVQSAIVTYQNLRLLPLAALSSLIDPLGVAVRTGTMKGAFDSYRDAVRAMRNVTGSDELRAMAEDMGIIERHAVSEALIYMYGGASDPTGLSARVNAALFKYNGLEYVTKFSRLAALANAHRFLLRHAAGGDPNSKRYLSELGLSAEDIKDDGTGHVKRNAKVDAALTRFVDESVVRPQPAQRPQWHNDPNFQLAAQYKGYLYSFWNTVVRRAALEVKNGNYNVLLPIMMYLPITAMGELLRDIAQGDDDDRDAVDYAKLSVERSGLLGPHFNLLNSAYQDTKFNASVLNSMIGPTGQQVAQAYDTLAGSRDISRTTVEALPGSALYEDRVL